MIQKFDIKDINKSSSNFNIEKLQWLNQQYLMSLDPVDVAKQLAFYMMEHGIDIESGPGLNEIVLLLRERCRTLVEMVENCRFFYQPVTEYDAKAVKKHIKKSSPAWMNGMPMVSIMWCSRWSTKKKSAFRKSPSRCVSR